MPKGFQKGKEKTGGRQVKETIQVMLAGFKDR